jgi:hypothetical protein
MRSDGIGTHAPSLCHRIVMAKDRFPLLRTMLFVAASFEAKNRVPLLRTMLSVAASFEAKNRIPLLRTML